MANFTKTQDNPSSLPILVSDIDNDTRIHCFVAMKYELNLSQIRYEFPIPWPCPLVELITPSHSIHYYGISVSKEEVSIYYGKVGALSIIPCKNVKVNSLSWEELLREGGHTVGE